MNRVKRDGRGGCAGGPGNAKIHIQPRASGLVRCKCKKETTSGLLNQDGREFTVCPLRVTRSHGTAPQS